VTAAAPPALAHDAGSSSLDTYEHGWLAALLPATARRVRVADPALAATLADAGAELVERDPDVEIGPADWLRGDAALGVVPFGAPPHDSPSRALRVARRALRSGQARVAAARARRTVARRGYPRTRVLLWDLRQPLRGPGGRPGSLVERLPQRALVVGARRESSATLVDACLVDAGGAVGVPLRAEPPTPRSGLLTAVTDRGVLRVAVGPSRAQIDAQVSALTTLHRLDPQPFVSKRVPNLLGHGRSGLARWSLEQRLPARRSPTALSVKLLEECVDFLVALHGARGGDAPDSLVARAELVARVRPAADGVRTLAARLEETLVDVPRGFGHGDFFLGNLLVDDRGALTGVVDWDAGGAGRLPLLDLVHLRHMAEYSLPDDDWGPSVLAHVLPWARAGGDEVARAYCRRVGFDADPRRLTALAYAYWLDRLGYQVRTHLHRHTEERWLERNVDLVLQAVSEDGWT
jgi:Phosphotransferase enzyme family